MEERTRENLYNTLYDFVERTLKDESPNPQALAIVPSVLSALEEYFTQL